MGNIDGHYPNVSLIFFILLCLVAIATAIMDNDEMRTVGQRRDAMSYTTCTVYKCIRILTQIKPYSYRPELVIKINKWTRMVILECDSNHVHVGSCSTYACILGQDKSKSVFLRGGFIIKVSLGSSLARPKRPCKRWLV